MTELGDACTELGKWLKVTETLLAVPDEQPQAGSRRGVALHDAPGSSPPWNPAVADALLDAFFGVRQIEADMRRQLDHLQIPRGGSAGNTTAALAGIAARETAVPAGTARYALRKVSRWLVAIKQLPAIDEEPRWMPLRRGLDGMPPKCPHCEFFSLRLAQGSQMVACWTPGCEDLDGHRPTGRIDLSRLDATPVLAWRDGITQ